MTKSKAKRIYNMIYKEICRNSMRELCEWWGVSECDVDEFMETALKAATSKQEESKWFICI